MSYSINLQWITLCRASWRNIPSYTKVSCYWSRWTYTCRLCLCRINWNTFPTAIHQIIWATNIETLQCCGCVPDKNLNTSCCFSSQCRTNIRFCPYKYSISGSNSLLRRPQWPTRTGHATNTKNPEYNRQYQDQWHDHQEQSTYHHRCRCHSNLLRMLVLPLNYR